MVGRCSKRKLSMVLTPSEPPKRTKPTSTLVAVKRRRRERKRTVRREGKNETRDKEGNVVCGEGEESFWAMEKVVGRRIKGGKVQYLVRWKGFSEAENTWEPAENLCDTAMADAMRFTKAMKKRQKELEDAGEMLLAPDDAMIQTVQSADIVPDEVPSDVNFQIATAGLEDGRWKWTDEEQVVFQQVERINVNDMDAKERVAAARVNGTPVVLIGHVGWANFARKWLEHPLPSSDQLHDDGQWLDLAKPHSLSIEKMVEDIGNEEVPVVRRNYNEANPIHANILASKFLTTCWPTTNETSSIPTAGSGTRLYLHQWQFPLSDTAGRKLCHQNNPLPNDILGEDLLKYWLDLPQCKGDSPLQYIFMGREETMSKLHRDNGGLAISIAPIVGEKECVLVHRSDGANCLYHLSAKVDDIDLHAYPLMTRARIWKTVVHPGEILLMPQGTYHQCRNVTPCLSYSRFHLDTVNLLAFLQSFIDGDAPEINHDEVLWNCTAELIRKVDANFDEIRARRKSKTTAPFPPLGDAMVKIIDTLRELRHICREINRRETIQNAVKGKREVETSIHVNRAADGSKLPPIAATGGAATIDARKMVYDWNIMVDDIDICLHEFRYRKMDRIPPFRPRREKSKDKVRAPLIGGSEWLDDSAAAADATDCGHDAPIVAYATDMESAFLDLPYASIRTFEDKKLAVFEEGDDVVVHLHGRRAEGTILEICCSMDAAYLSYEDYPAFYDEYQPYEKLRSPIGGDRSAEIAPQDVKPGIVVTNRWGDHGDEYRAVIRHTSTEKFFKVQLNLGRVRVVRWVPGIAIVKKM
jgi:Chromo (CHRromatin Organisation MOdifier) domain/Cupin-like domain